MTDEEKQWLTMTDIVKRTGLPEWTVRKYLKDPDNPGHIPSQAYPIRNGKAVTHRVSLEDFETWWAAHQS